ncbi:dTMP kinase [Pseudonocardia charpentierae]|uniref:dTMP kinase n=1 Tax=Pseudonocardia charpentierae TaxID=3075545 RepID=A0ABU2NCV0_9PSEU|nr:dTMP kinase [Pseudonocardia sp. DSM 45834]MDT0351694.1 dTMP kinase [Pseudonocardia sp. DSM 45834]
MLTPLLQRLGSVLDEAGVAWSVVHEESGPQIDDVTLHVAPADADVTVDALDRCGFAPLGSGTGHLAPDGPRWLRVRLDSGGAPGRTCATSRGVTVALLGPDGVGKSTLLAGLATAYPLAIRQIYMGMWQGAGQPGYTRLDAVRAILVRPFRVWWRVLCGAVHVARGRVVVFDRYTYDALLPVTGSWPLLKRPYFWVLAHLAPRPDLVLVLDLPGEVAFARKGESTPERLEAVRQGFLALVPRLGAEVVDAAAPPEQVRADVVARIWQRHRARLAEDPVSRPRPAARTAAPSAPEPAPPATPR